MNVKSLIASVVETILKVVLIALAISLILKYVTLAYEFGYKVFADEPMSANNPKTISIGIAEGESVSDVADMLQEKGLIADAKLFRVQELLSAYHDKIKPGYYDLSTGMTANEMLQIMSEGSEEISDEAVPASASPVDQFEEYDDGPAEEYSNGLIDELDQGEGEDMIENEGEGE